MGQPLYSIKSISLSKGKKSEGERCRVGPGAGKAGQQRGREPFRITGHSRYLSETLAARRSSVGRSTGHQAMILTRDEISFLDVYCHEGTEPPFGGPA